MITCRFLIAALLLLVAPQPQPRLPIHLQSLTYPPRARGARIHGDVEATIHIGSDGSVSIPTRPSGHPMFVEAAEENLKTWKFQPCESREMVITYHFKLRESPSGSDQTQCLFDLPDSVTVTSDGPPVPITYSSPKH